MTHICVEKLTIIGSDNGLSPGWRQVIIWTNAGILLMGPLGTNFSGILIGIQTFSFKKFICKCRLRNGVYLVSASMISRQWHQQSNHRGYMCNSPIPYHNKEQPRSMDMFPETRITEQFPLQRRHNERDNVSNHQPHDCLLNRLFRRRSNKTSKLRVTGLCVGNSPGTGEFPA